MRTLLTKILLSSGICLLLAGTLLHANDAPKLSRNGMISTFTRAVVSGDNAYVLGPVETITDVIRMGKPVASPDDGAVLIAVYKNRPYPRVALTLADVEAGTPRRSAERNLIYWDVRTRVAKTILRETNTPEMESTIDGIQWLPETPIALVTIVRTNLADGTGQRSLMRVDAAVGTVRRVAGLESTSGVVISPTQPLAYIENEAVEAGDGKPGVPPTLQTYTSQGLGRLIRLDEGIGALEWALDGKSVYATRVIERVEGKRKSRALLTLVNLTTGEVTHPEKLPTAHNSRIKSSPAPKADWAIAPVTTKIRFPGPGGQPQDTTALWIQAAPSLAALTNPNKEVIPVSPAPANNRAFADALLIATNVQVEGYLVRGNTAVILFTRDNSLCAAPVFRLTKSEFEQGLRQRQQDVTISNARQLGLSIIMYTQDYDENYPLPGSGVAKAIEPYTKSSTLFTNPVTGAQGFVYTLTGSTAMVDMAEPATTQLGYLSGPGGRAIIWADGRVTWQDDPPTP
ncbi:MAG: hypothetical protein H7145_23290 [Akkermansiaceae bacterium]|nr:hypothetical protein [Armatimonadota bacterium]